MIVTINMKMVLIQPPVLVTAVDAIRHHVARGRQFCGALQHRRLYYLHSTQRDATMAQTINCANPPNFCAREELLHARRG